MKEDREIIFQKVGKAMDEIILYPGLKDYEIFIHVEYGLYNASIKEAEHLSNSLFERETRSGTAKDFSVPFRKSQDGMRLSREQSRQCQGLNLTGIKLALYLLLIGSVLQLLALILDKVLK